MGSKTDYLEDKILDHNLVSVPFTTPGAVFSALFTTIPSDSTATGEMTAATSGYTRVTTSFGSAGATVTGQSVNTAAVTFGTAASAFTVVGWGLYDSGTAGAGNVLYWATVTTLAVGIGDQPVFAVGNITITED
jgi:hypothetical protein